MGPPNSVKIASPLPTHYFAPAFGDLATLPSHFQFHVGQPFMPEQNGSVRIPVAIPLTATLPLGDRINNLFRHPNSPWGWWQRQLAHIDFRRF